MSLLPFPGAAPLSVDVELPTKKKTVELLVVGLSCHEPNPLPAWLPLDQMPLYGIDPQPTCVDGAATEENGLPTSAKKSSQAIVACGILPQLECFIMVLRLPGQPNVFEWFVSRTASPPQYERYNPSSAYAAKVPFLD